MSECAVVVDQDVCIGAGLCAESSPDRFEVTDDGVAVPLYDELPEVEEELLERARGCPSGAISIYRDGAEVDIF